MAGKPSHNPEPFGFGVFGKQVPDTGRGPLGAVETGQCFPARFTGRGPMGLAWPYSEERGLRFENEGKHPEAAQEFWGAAMALRATDPQKAIGLIERAAVSYLRARDGMAIYAFTELTRIDAASAGEAAGRIAGFCEEEAQKTADAWDAAYLRRVSDYMRKHMND